MQSHWQPSVACGRAEAAKKPESPTPADCTYRGLPVASAGSVGNLIGNPKSRVLGACANREAQNRAGLKILIALGNGGYHWEPEVPGSANREAQNGAGLFSFCRLRRGLSVFIVSLSFCFVVYRRAS